MIVVASTASAAAARVGTACALPDKRLDHSSGKSGEFEGKIQLAHLVITSESSPTDSPSNQRFIGTLCSLRHFKARLASLSVLIVPVVSHKHQL